MMNQDDEAAPKADDKAPQAQGVLKFMLRYGVILALVATFLVFSLLSPDAFFTLYTMKSILRDTVPLLILALGITFVLVMNDFDLSVGGLTALLATTSVLLVSTEYVGLPVPIAVLTTIALGGLLGFFNGVLIAYVKLPSFILTIAMGTVFTGIGLKLTSSRSVFGGVPDMYGAIARSSVFGVSSQVFIGLGALLVVHFFLRHSETGRYFYAIGGNPEVARLSGVRVKFLKALGYGIVGVAAAMAAILLTSQANAANPNTGLGLLLPVYAAAFLGSSVFRLGTFTAVGTAIAALYLQMIGTGLTILNLSGPDIQIIQGAILAAAILLARINQDTAK